jgi:hypothetical protein
MMSNIDIFLGIVKEGKLHLLTPPAAAGQVAGLTTIDMQVSIPPDSAEIDLTPYEGQILLVRGRGPGEWIWAAEILDQGGPLLAFLAEEVFTTRAA